MSDPVNYSFGKDAIGDEDTVAILDAVESEYLGTKLGETSHHWDWWQKQ